MTQLAFTRFRTSGLAADGWRGAYNVYGKRAVDLLASIAALVLLVPVLVCIAIAIRVRLGAPIFFVQHRAGLGRKLFALVKFRTMTDARDPYGRLLSDADRLTGLGRWLRRWSLDELPEFLNVLKGEMSLVGPRPLIERYLPYFTEEESKRFRVKPGITGLAQVKGRNYATWDERLENDAFYADHVSFLLDCSILMRTLRMVCKAHGVVVDPMSAMQNLDDERREAPSGGAGIEQRHTSPPFADDDQVKRHERQPTS